MNNKLTEFIIKHQEFYNNLSDVNKKYIANLDEYFDLEIYDNPSRKSYEESNTHYLLIGKVSNFIILYSCPVEIDKKCQHLHISKVCMVLAENLRKYWKNIIYEP